MAIHADLLSGEVRQSEEFAHTIDRIAARLGEQQIHGVKCVADHRPEASWAMAAADDKRPPLTFPDRPLWLLPEPKPLSALPYLASGPERIEGGWWDGGDVQRDYFIARTSQGAALWIFQDLNNGSWHLHGFWS
jgi:protein ImuB